MKDDVLAYKNPALTNEERARDLIPRMTLEEKVSQLLYTSKAIPRLDIPEYNWWNECLHGIARAGKATIFPQAIGMAATFDTKLLYRVADAISDEARAKYAKARDAGAVTQYKGLTFWTPNINIFRDPRWGRGQETYGEDPYLTARLGVSLVKGLQQMKNGKMKAAGCAKHFAVHSGPEALRHEFDARVSKKDLYETYLPAFKALVQEAGVESVMGAYNRTNGEPCCGSETLLRKILRQEWGFKGHVVSDCWAINDFHMNHKVTLTVEESAAMAINNGCELNCGCAYEALMSAIKQGLVTEKTVDDSLFDLLVTRFKLGLLDPKEADPWKDIPFSVVDSEEHRQLSREAARKSIVLLKNEGNLLPLKKDLNKVYLTGPNTTNIDALIGNYYGMNGKIVTPLEGVTAAVSENTTVDYRLGSLLDREKPNPVDWASFEAKQADVVLAFLGIDGTLEGEEGDAIASYDKGDRINIDMPKGQLEFLKKLKVHGKPIVAVMFGGSPIIMKEVHEIADAVVWAWYPGEEGGTAIADILFGDVSPAGKLPITFPYSLDQLPPYDEYAMKGRTYRYMKDEPMYPFGFGLTYTAFEYSGIELSGKTVTAGSSLDVTVTVRNKGSRDCEEVVQLYVTDLEASVTVPFYQLCGFERIEIPAGGSKKVTFTLTSADLELVDNDGKRVLEKGAFRVTAGSSAPLPRAAALGAPVPVSAEFTVI